MGSINANSTVVLIDTIPSSKSVNLPSTASIYGKQIYIKDSTGSAATHPVAINTVGADVFEDNQTVMYISTGFGYTTLVAADGKWIRLANPYDSLGSNYIISTIGSFGGGGGGSLIGALQYTPQTIANGVTKFSPTDITSLSIWVDGADANTVTYDTNNNISAVSNKAGVDTFVNMASPPPVYATKIQNRKNVMQFNGATTGLVNETYNFSNPVSIFSVQYLQTNSGNIQAVVADSNATDLFVGASNGAANIYTSTSSGANIQPAVINTGDWLITSYIGDSNIVPFINGTGKEYKSGITNPFTGITLGDRWNGYIAEMVLYNTPLITRTRHIIEGYLAWKWNLQKKLPTNHLYKSRAPFSSDVQQIAAPVIDFVSTSDGSLAWYPSSGAAYYKVFYKARSKNVAFYNTIDLNTVSHNSTRNLFVGDSGILTSTSFGGILFGGILSGDYNNFYVFAYDSNNNRSSFPLTHVYYANQYTIYLWPTVTREYIDGLTYPTSTLSRLTNRYTNESMIISHIDYDDAGAIAPGFSAIHNDTYIDYKEI